MKRRGGRVKRSKARAVPTVRGLRRKGRVSRPNATPRTGRPGHPCRRRKQPTVVVLRLDDVMEIIDRVVRGAHQQLGSLRDIDRADGARKVLAQLAKTEGILPSSLRDDIAQWLAAPRVGFSTLLIQGRQVWPPV